MCMNVPFILLFPCLCSPELSRFMFKYVDMRVQIQCPPYRAYRCLSLLPSQSGGLVGEPWRLTGYGARSGAARRPESPAPPGRPQKFVCIFLTE